MIVFKDNTLSFETDINPTINVALSVYCPKCKERTEFTKDQKTFLCYNCGNDLEERYIKVPVL